MKNLLLIPIFLTIPYVAHAAAIVSDEDKCVPFYVDEEKWITVSYCNGKWNYYNDKTKEYWKLEAKDPLVLKVVASTNFKKLFPNYIQPK